MEKQSTQQDSYQFLVEKEAMWAEMLTEALKGNGIPCTALSVYGAGLVMKTGMRERKKIFVAPDKKSMAEEIMEELFANSDNS